MTINYTTLLGLAQPVTGTEANTWGTVVNDEITALVDSAVAGTTTISADADVTLTTTAGAANQSRQAIILWTAGGTVTRNITAPAQSKVYMVINATSSTQSIVLRGVGPTTGVTVVAGEKCVAAWNGSDFVKIATTTVDGVSTISFGSTGLTPSTATSGAVSVAGTLATTNGGTNLTSFTSGGAMYATSTSALTTGTLPNTAGGTGQSSAFTQWGVTYASSTTALATTAAGTAGYILTSNGTSAPTFQANTGISTGKSIAMAMIFGG